MLTASEINRKVKAGKTVLVLVPGLKGEQQVLRVRVGLTDSLQAQIMLDGKPCWRNVEWSSIRVPPAPIEK